MNDHASRSRDEIRAYTLGFVGRTIDIVIDRPIGHMHHGTVYTVNYGYIPETRGGDGEELDVYLLGVDEPIGGCTAKIIAAVLRNDDVEDKLVACPDEKSFEKADITSLISFIEKYFDSTVITQSELELELELKLKLKHKHNQA